MQHARVVAPSQPCKRESTHCPIRSFPSSPHWPTSLSASHIRRAFPPQRFGSVFTKQTEGTTGCMAAAWHPRRFATRRRRHKDVAVWLPDDVDDFCPEYTRSAPTTPSAPRRHSCSENTPGKASTNAQFGANSAENEKRKRREERPNSAHRQKGKGRARQVEGSATRRRRLRQNPETVLFLHLGARTAKWAKGSQGQPRATRPDRPYNGTKERTTGPFLISLSARPSRPARPCPDPPTQTHGHTAKRVTQRPEKSTPSPSSSPRSSTTPGRAAS